ncbi:CKLF-like MARVEL transmembrane domain-containing protein 3 isoform X1 [Catharus ustulatus]|uniref:CKLF-like MARVEL transmembrane domain-containing protein 3 isoform X1 n=1 Tax=Catharus ustulatus TaxID=91951 RepID=UPI001408BC33|nr:CKLF-like MARVEL transmembrane domain-containing protein 3 isoform X1 [Catharus ustulatus]
MEDPESEGAAPPPGLSSLLPPREFLRSRKGQLLLAESVLSFIIFICYIASLAASFMMAPLLEFLLALFLFFAYASKLNEKFKGVHWPLADFLRCVTAAIIYFAISIAAVSKYSDGASKAAGVFGFAATIVFAVDFYITFNDLVTFLKQGSSDSPEGRKAEESLPGYRGRAAAVVVENSLGCWKAEHNWMLCSASTWFYSLSFC